ncbi:MAG: hypothetical protein RSA29_10530 [Clostridium sp.]|uniref:hypothetical protein n=1 Tax=Clostridium sp. TaxID=1506 RepID=UPI002FCBE4BD
MLTKIWTSEGIYNPEDLNRVESNIIETLDELKYLCKTAGIGKTKVDRTYADVEFADSLNRIESNIESLKNQFHEVPGWIPTKNTWRPLEPFSFIDANRLEINIKLLYELIRNAKASIQFCGVIDCGDDTRLF